jgi:thioredoxin reductase
VVDELPALDGIEPLYGKSVHHCPYCDGWEWRDRTLASYGRGEAGAALAIGLTVWSRDVLLCTDGPADLPRRMRTRLERLRIPVREDRVLRLEGRDGRLERIVFEGGAVEPREALFFATGQRQASDLAARLGCRFTKEGTVATGRLEATNVPGLFVCGDASRDAQLAIVAAAEGAAAAMAINQALLEAALAADQKSTSKPSRISLGGP